MKQQRINELKQLLGKIPMTAWHLQVREGRLNWMEYGYFCLHHGEIFATPDDPAMEQAAIPIEADMQRMVDEFA